MARQKEKSLVQLLRSTMELSESRASCVLDGKARMRGPGVVGSLANTEYKKVFDTCGDRTLETDVLNCRTCDQVFHTGCLDPPNKVSSGGNWICSQCQGKDISNPRQETDLDPSCSSTYGENPLAREVDPKFPREHEMSKDEQSLLVRHVEDGSRTLEQPQTGPSEVTGVNPSGLHGEVHYQDDGCSTEQVGIVEYVRRSKRGRPYKPVGGLHPNKRRSIDNVTRGPEKGPQEKARPVIDEEDELGAKIEKFRVISSIDNSDVKSLPCKEEGKGATLKTPEECADLHAATLEIDESTNTISKGEVVLKSEQARMVEDTVAAEVVGNQGFGNELSPKSMEVENPSDAGSLDEKLGISLVAELQPSITCTLVETPGSFVAPPDTSNETHVRRITSCVNDVAAESVEIASTVSDVVKKELRNQLSGVNQNDSKRSSGVDNVGICLVSPAGDDGHQPLSNRGLVTSISSVESTDNANCMTLQGPDGSNSKLNLIAGIGGDVCFPPPTFSESSVIKPRCSSSATNVDFDYLPLQSSPTSVFRGKGQGEDAPPKVEAGLPLVIQADSMIAASQAVVKGAPEGNPRSTSATSSKAEKCELASEGSLDDGKDTAKTSRQQNESTGKNFTPLETTDISFAMDRPVSASSVDGDVNIKPSQSADTSHELGCKREAEDGSIWPAPTATAASPIHIGRNPDDSSVMTSNGGSPGAASDISEEVKVCDICGDVGYEECLAVCGACNEGAEHIYCMQVLLHAIPDDGWSCDGCKSKNMAGSLKEMDGSHSRAHLESIHASNRKPQITKSTSRARLSARLDKGKGNAHRIAVPKGPPSHQLSSKRLASDTLTTPAKRYVLESPGAQANVPNAVVPRILTKEASYKAPDSAKVKFLSQDALASIPVGSGSRQSSKAAGSRGISSQSPRPGPTQTPRSGPPSKDRCAPTSSAQIDAQSGAACVATKQSPLTSRQSPLSAKAPTMLTGRGSGSLKTKEPLSSFLLPVRSGCNAFTKGNEEGSSDGNRPNSMGRGTGTGAGFQAGEGGGTGWSGRKMSSKLVDTSCSSSQSQGFPRPCHPLKLDPAICSTPFDNSEISENAVPLTKRSQTSDPPKFSKVLVKLPSSSPDPNTRLPQNEANCNPDVQDFRSSREPVSSSGPGTESFFPSPTLQSLVNRKSSENVRDLEGGQGGSPLAERVEGISKIQSLNTTGLGEWQRVCTRISGGDELVSKNCKSPRESVVSSSIQFSGVKDSQECNGKEWLPSHLTSKPSTRCYKCKEIGHAAQVCGDRRAGMSGRTDNCASNIEARLKAAPKYGPNGAISFLRGRKGADVGSLEYQKDAPGLCADQSTNFPSQETERAGLVPVPESRAVLQQGPVSISRSGHHEESAQKSLLEARTQQGSVRVEDTSKTSGQSIRSPPGVNCDGLEAKVAGKANDFPDRKLAALTYLSGRKQSILVPAGQVRNLAGLPDLDSPRPGAFKETQGPEIGTRATDEATVRFSHGGAPASRIEVKTLSGPPAPEVSYNFNHAAVPSPMVMLPRGLNPWGQVAPSPPVPAIGRVASQNGRGIQARASPGFRSGPPPFNAFGSPRPSAVPESHWLWRGRFEVVSAAVPAMYDGLQAYSSSVAAPKVRAVTKTLPFTLQLEEVKRMFNADAWPKQFQQKPPTGHEIALYFFPEFESLSRFEPAYMRLLEHMIAEDLVLMGHVEGAEILIFPSHLLSAEHHSWRNKKFLWGVYRARKSNPSSASTPLSSGQIPPSSFGQSSVKVEDRGKLGMSFGVDTREVDMAADMIGNRERDVLLKPAQKSGWSKSSSLSSPPLPPDPPPIQPPPPSQPTSWQEATPMQHTTSMELKKCSDLPPGFTFASQKRVPVLSAPQLSELMPGGPPGLHPPLGEGGTTLPGNFEESAVVGTARRPNLDFPSKELTPKQDSMGHAVTVPFAHQLSFVASAPKDWKGGLVTARQNVMASHSSLQSPGGLGDQLKDWNIGMGSFSRRERGNQRASGTNWEREEGGASASGREWERDRTRGGDRVKDKERERGRQKGSNRQEDEEAWWEDKELRRHRWREREREDRDDKLTLGRTKHGNNRHRHVDQQRKAGKDYQNRRYARSCSMSESRSRSLSSSRQRRQQSPSVSPTSQQNSGRWHSILQSRSRSNSPDSSDRRRRKGPFAGESSGGRSPDESTPRRVTSRWDVTVEEAKPTHKVAPCVELSEKGRMAPVSVREELGLTEMRSQDSAEGVTQHEPSEEGVSLPVREVGEASSSNLLHKDDKEQFVQGNGKQDPNPFYRVFLPSETRDTRIFEAKSEQRDFSHTQQSSLGVSAPNFGAILKNLSSGAELLSSGPWESADRSGFQFFPMAGRNDGEYSRASSKKVPTGVDDGNGLVSQSSDLAPFFVPLVDKAVSLGQDHPDPGGAQLIEESSGRTLEFPLVTDKEGTSVASAVDVGSLNLTLSVPQYRKEGNAWVKIKDAEALLGEEDVDFALTL